MIEINNQCLTIIQWVEMKSLIESVEILSSSQMLSFFNFQECSDVKLLTRDKLNNAIYLKYLLSDSQGFFVTWTYCLALIAKITTNCYKKSFN